MPYRQGVIIDTCLAFQYTDRIAKSDEAKLSTNCINLVYTNSQLSLSLSEELYDEYERNSLKNFIGFIARLVSKGRVNKFADAQYDTLYNQMDKCLKAHYSTCNGAYKNAKKDLHLCVLGVHSKSFILSYNDRDAKKIKKSVASNHPLMKVCWINPKNDSNHEQKITNVSKLTKADTFGEMF